jgi:hypothetical protein
MRISKELQIGKAGEYLVCADLVMKGFVAYPSEQGLPYDVVLDTGKKIIRVQVKTCEKPRIMPQRAKDTLVYQFAIKMHGKHRNKMYGDDEVDIFALATLDTRSVGYVKGKDMKSTTNFRVDSLRESYYDEKGVKDYEKVIELHKTIESPSEIGRIVGISATMVCRMLKEDYKPYVTSAKYFSDIFREKEWFDEL